MSNTVHSVLSIGLLLIRTVLTPPAYLPLTYVSNLAFISTSVLNSADIGRVAVEIEWSGKLRIKSYAEVRLCVDFRR